MDGSIYHFLGLSTGIIVHGLEDEERRRAYAATLPTAPTMSSASTISATI